MILLNNLILFLIRFLHLLLFLFLLLSIFINNKNYKEVSLTILLFLLFHYLTNYGKCGLTQLEYILLQENYKKGFLYRLINPIINKDEKYFNYYFYIFHILWICILINQIFF